MGRQRDAGRRLQRAKHADRPTRKTLKSIRDRLLILDVSLDGAPQRIADLTAAGAEHLIAHQHAVFQIHVQLPAVERCVDDAARRRALRLREVPDDQATAGELDACVAIVAGIADLQGIVRRDQRAVFKHRIRILRHLRMTRADVRSSGITPPIETCE